MKRRAVIFLMIVVCFILQTAVFPMISFLAAVPNLLLFLTVAVAFMQGSREGALTGFAAGFFIDLFYEPRLGFYALLFVVCGYAAGGFAERYFDEDIKMPVILTIAADLFCNVVIYICGFLLRGRGDFVGCLRQIILPEAVSTAIIVLLLYRPIYKINHLLLEKEKKSRYSLWIRD